ncbi:hypothetical protein [Sphingomonas sp.]|uniref:hypothetical protein n=1 Tax=Sphingomonas sp. TaxID=28214 RepID=UPI001D241446|nr:hypothetical protein [Sphingomonas sp.]MBX9796416.1 hypothetical protein [Sphingomonas sp.]
MMRRLALPAALMLVLGTGASTAQTMAMQLPCVTAPEAEAVITSVLPETVDQLGSICAGALPAGAVLRQPPAELMARYRADADAAWPAAQGAVARIAGPQAGALLTGAAARPLVGGLIAPVIVRAVQPADCAAYDRIFTLAQPLPPRNLAGILVAAWTLADSRRGAQSTPASTARPGLTLCPVRP